MSIATAVENVDFRFRTKNKGTENEVTRSPISVKVPLPTKAGIIQALESGDEKLENMLVYSAQEIVINYLKGFVDENLEFSQETADALAEEGKLSLEAIANLPRSARSRLSKADIEEFCKDYIAYMPAISGKSEDQVKAAAKVYLDQFKDVAGDNKILSILAGQLELFMDKVDESVVEKHGRVLEHLVNKVDELKKVEFTEEMF